MLVATVLLVRGLLADDPTGWLYAAAAAGVSAAVALVLGGRAGSLRPG